MTNKTDAKLQCFFIFNPSFYSNEGDEEKKILYYYPPKTDLDVQLKNAGLCEALIKFTQTFDSSEPCKSFYTEKTRQFFYQPEKNFWMIMVVSVPYTKKQTTENNGTIEYHGELVQDNVYGSVLKLAYKQFRLFNGTFNKILELTTTSLQDNIIDLRNRLCHFFNKYLPSLKLTCDILEVFQGISFLPLGKDPFLHVQCFINLVEMKFKSVKYSVFLYNDQLVWSGIAPEDMQVLYQYLTNTLLPAHLDLELQGGSLQRPPNSAVHHYGSFVTGPPGLQDSIVSTKKVPRVYLENDTDSREVFHLVVYRALSATLCLLMDEEDSLSLNLFRELDTFLGPRLTTLVSEVSEHYSKHVLTSNENSPKFVYYNKLNLAQKSTVHVGNRKNGNIGNVPHDMLKIMCDVNNAKAGCMSSEVMIKSANDCWLICKYSNAREFYVVISQKKASLIDASEEVKKLCDTELKGIFFIE